MREQLALFEKLQEVDCEIMALINQRDEIPQKIEKLLIEVRQHEKGLNEQQQKKDEIEKEKRELEGRLEDELEKLRKAQTFQHEVKNQKEYEALLREIEGYKRTKNYYEDEIIRSLELYEELKKSIKKIEEECATSREAVSQQEKELQKKMADLTSKVDDMNRNRDAMIQGIAKQWLRKYNTIRERREGIAVVAADDGVCMGCNINLPPQLFNILQRMDSIELCPTCQRILIYQEPSVQEDE